MSIHWSQLDTLGKIDAIKRVYVPGMSASKIAAAIGDGVTRNAIIGMYGRHGDKLSDCPLTGLPGKPMTPEAQKARAALAVKRTKNTGGLAAVNAVRLVQRRAAAPGLRPQMPPADVPAPLNIPLMDLERHHCRWPVTDEGPHLFCGNQIEHRNYCAGHFALSVGRGTESERSADRTLLKAAA